jgi:hypothetical protein
MELTPSSTRVSVSAGPASLLEGHVFVGNLPSMSFINYESEYKKKPATVLGLDFLRWAYRVILRVPAKELWIEELKDQPRYNLTQ